MRRSKHERWYFFPKDKESGEKIKEELRRLGHTKEEDIKEQILRCDDGEQRSLILSPTPGYALVCRLWREREVRKLVFEIYVSKLELPPRLWNFPEPRAQTLGQDASTAP